MIDDKIIEDLQAQLDDLKAISQQQVEELRVKFLGKKGEITKLFEEFRTVQADQKKLFGQKLNNNSGLASSLFSTSATLPCARQRCNFFSVLIMARPAES